jgi:hypothetical protein
MKHTSKARRLLVISYHFPPDGAVGGQRWAGLSKYLARLGWEVHVVTAAPLQSEPAIPGVYRHVRHRRRTVHDLYKEMVARRAVETNTGRRPSATTATRRQSPVASALALVRKIVGNLIYMPDIARGWVGRATGAARALLRERRFDVVISSGPPHSAHFAALLATRGTGTEFWIDMRDPWSSMHEMHLPEDRFIRAERRLLHRLERFVLRRARRIIVNTREFESALKIDQPGSDVLWFPNGIDMEQLPRREPTDIVPGSISYVGALYAHRNLSSILTAMGAVLRDKPGAAKALRLNIVGPLDSANREQTLQQIATAGLGSHVTIHGVLPRRQALEVLSRSHLALVLAQDQPMCVPAKVYESVGLGIPTLVIAEKGSAAACEAVRIGAMSLGNGDIAGLQAVIEGMLAGRMPLEIKPPGDISYEELAVQMDGLLQRSLTASGGTATRPL